MKRFFFVLSCLLVASAARLPSQETKPGPGKLVVDKEKKTVTIDVLIALRKLPHLKGEIYPLEVIATWAHPKGKKAHETIVTLDDSIKPSDVHKALESLGLKAGTPVMGPGEPKGPALNVFLILPDPTGFPRKVTLDKVMVDKRSGKPFPKNIEWRFTGSKMVQPDPNKDAKVYGADHSGTLMSIFPVTAETVLQTNLTIDFEKFMKLEVNTKVLPKTGTPVKLVIEVKKK
ncbi:MAG: hypothetical protein HYX68_28675 [Planctomycetes bacterium]|nr:hypothetical protein [Planctomycetota bacterium]